MVFRHSQLDCLPGFSNVNGMMASGQNLRFCGEEGIGESKQMPGSEAEIQRDETRTQSPALETAVKPALDCGSTP
jgi:hypothetical protein